MPSISSVSQSPILPETEVQPATPPTPAPTLVSALQHTPSNDKPTPASSLGQARLTGPESPNRSLIRTQLETLLAEARKNEVDAYTAAESGFSNVMQMKTSETGIKLEKKEAYLDKQLAFYEKAMKAIDATLPSLRTAAQSSAPAGATTNSGPTAWVAAFEQQLHTRRESMRALYALAHAAVNHEYLHNRFAEHARIKGGEPSDMDLMRIAVGDRLLEAINGLRDAIAFLHTLGPKTVLSTATPNFLLLPAQPTSHAKKTMPNPLIRCAVSLYVPLCKRLLDYQTAANRYHGRIYPIPDTEAILQQDWREALRRGTSAVEAKMEELLERAYSPLEASDEQQKRWLEYLEAAEYAHTVAFEVGVSGAALKAFELDQVPALTEVLAAHADSLSALQGNFAVLMVLFSATQPGADGPDQLAGVRAFDHGLRRVVAGLQHWTSAAKQAAPAGSKKNPKGPGTTPLEQAVYLEIGKRLGALQLDVEHFKAHLPLPSSAKDQPRLEALKEELQENLENLTKKLVATQEHVAARLEHFQVAIDDRVPPQQAVEFLAQAWMTNAEREHLQEHLPEHLREQQRQAALTELTASPEASGPSAATTTPRRPKSKKAKKLAPPPTVPASTSRPATTAMPGDNLTRLHDLQQRISTTSAAKLEPTLKTLTAANDYLDVHGAMEWASADLNEAIEAKQRLREAMTGSPSHVVARALLSTTVAQLQTEIAQLTAKLEEVRAQGEERLQALARERILTHPTSALYYILDQQGQFRTSTYRPENIKLGARDARGNPRPPEQRDIVIERCLEVEGGKVALHVHLTPKGTLLCVHFKRWEQRGQGTTDSQTVYYGKVNASEAKALIESVNKHLSADAKISVKYLESGT